MRGLSLDLLGRCCVGGFIREPPPPPCCVHIPGRISVRFYTDGNAYRRLGREPRRGREFGAFLSVLGAIGFVRAQTRTLPPPLRLHSRVSPSRESLPYPRNAAGVRGGLTLESGLYSMGTKPRRVSSANPSRVLLGLLRF